MKELESWSVVMCPTDTCYWFSTTYDNEKWIKNIQKIKKRFWNKPFSLLFSSIFQAKQYCEISKKDEEFILSHSNKSSFIVKKKSLLDNYFSNFDTVCIRIENEAYAYKPASYFWKPVTTTSVNISWHKILNTRPDILDEFWKYPFIHFVFSENFLAWSASDIWDLSLWNSKKIR